MAKVMIVFEEQDNAVFTEPRFNVYLDGVSVERIREIDRMTQVEAREKCSTAEFWAHHCFKIVVGAIRASGAVEKEIQR